MTSSPARLADIPGLSNELIVALDRMHPEKCPSPNDSEREIWMYAGARELVRKLTHVHEQQKKLSVQNFDGKYPA